ncbi:MAG TPA: hypothetical protein DC064_08730 [Cyanobacteria bacterium UBA9273]|nr:hypothetical protein [Cyanobacteria bacterium UBA9273]
MQLGISLYLSRILKGTAQSKQLGVILAIAQFLGCNKNLFEYCRVRYAVLTHHYPYIKLGSPEG